MNNWDQILMAYSIEELAKKVIADLKEGWMPLGGIAVLKTKYPTLRLNICKQYF